MMMLAAPLFLDPAVLPAVRASSISEADILRDIREGIRDTTGRYTNAPPMVGDLPQKETVTSQASTGGLSLGPMVLIGAIAVGGVMALASRKR